MNKVLCDYDNLYYIGGIVRDKLLGIRSFDVDITYAGNAVEFCKNLSRKGIGEIKQINKDFATVRMVIDGKVIDFASTRDEVYERKGHLPKVFDIGCNLKKDVLRRDFTINALAESVKTGEIIDYIGGISDLNSKKLRVLHDNSFIDDPTRIIRGLKFSVRFGFNLDEHTKELQERYLSNVNYDMSRKRLKKELVETFNLNSQKAYRMFFEQKMNKLLSEHDMMPLDYDIESLVNEFPVRNTWLVYLGCCELDGIPLNKEEQRIIDDFKMLNSLKIANDEFSIYKAFENKMMESVLLYTAATKSDKGLRYFKIKDVKPLINGDDLIKLGIKPSARFKECFDYILQKKLSYPEMSYNDELESAKNFFK